MPIKQRGMVGTQQPLAVALLSNVYISWLMVISSFLALYSGAKVALFC